MHEENLCCGNFDIKLSQRATRFIAQRLRQVIDESTRYGSDDRISFKWGTDPAWSIFSLPKQKQHFQDYNEFRRDLFECSGLKTGVIIQIIGDSSPPFSSEGTIAAQVILNRLLNPIGSFLLLWGFTGCIDLVDGGLDTNQLVNTWIDEDPQIRSQNCFANIVDDGTMRALTEYHSSCPIGAANKRNIILVTGSADFGDDIETSDNLTDHLVVFEGGIQSFTQLVNCFIRRCRITIITGLRRPGVSNRFSASGFLVHLIHRSSNQSINDVMSAYLSIHSISDSQLPMFTAALNQLAESSDLSRLADIEIIKIKSIIYTHTYLFRAQKASL